MGKETAEIFSSNGTTELELSHVAMGKFGGGVTCRSHRIKDVTAGVSVHLMELIWTPQGRTLKEG